MKNRNLTKIFVLIVAMALLVGSVVGLSVSAEGGTAPKIVSQNISYDGDFSIMYAVEKATVTEGQSITLNVYDAVPAEGVDPIWTKTLAYDAPTSQDPGVESYIFTTPGVAAKDMGVTYYAEAVCGTAKSAVKRYSVAEYAFEMLFSAGKVNATEGADLARKEMYLSMLAFGSDAQYLLNGLNSAEALVEDYLYAKMPAGYAIDGVYNAATYKNNTTEITLPEYTGALVGDKPAKGWYVVKYSADTYERSEEILQAGTVVTVDAYTVITLSDKAESAKHEGGVYYNSDAEGVRYDFETGTMENAKEGFIGSSDWKEPTSDRAILETLGDDNKYAHLYRTGSADANFYLTYTDSNTTSGTTTVENHVMIMELDVKFENLVYSSGNNTPYKFVIHHGTGTNLRTTFYFGLSSDGTLSITGTNTIHTAENASALEQDTWYNIRFEIWSDHVTKIYVNGTYWKTIKGDGGSKTAAIGALIYIQQFKDTNPGLCFDNMYFGEKSEAYVAEQ